MNNTKLKAEYVPDDEGNTGDQQPAGGRHFDHGPYGGDPRFNPRWMRRTADSERGSHHPKRPRLLGTNKAFDGFVSKREY